MDGRGKGKVGSIKQDKHNWMRILGIRRLFGSLERGAEMWPCSLTKVNMLTSFCFCIYADFLLERNPVCSDWSPRWPDPASPTILHFAKIMFATLVNSVIGETRCDANTVP